MSDKLELATKANAMAATIQMETSGLSWVNVRSVVERILKILQDEGKTGLDIVESLLKMIGYFTTRDVSGILAMIKEVTDSVEKVINAIREEFGV